MEQLKKIIELLKKADRVVIYIRHLIPEPWTDGCDDEERELSSKGIAQARVLQPFYATVLAILAEHGLTKVRVFSSHAVRAIKSGELLFPDHTIESKRELRVVDEERFADGNWYDIVGNDWSIQREMRELAQNPECLEGVWTPIDSYYIVKFVRDVEGVTVILGHEFNASLTALAHEIDHHGIELGLEEGQAYMFFFKGAESHGVIKLIPE